VLKRKFKALEARSADARELLERLRTAPYEDAMQLLAQLRSQDLSPAVQTSCTLQDTATMMAAPTTRPLYPLSAIEAQHTFTPESVDAPSGSIDPPTVYPNPDLVTAGPSWTQPIDPYVCQSSVIKMFLYGPH
jgi:hypothetical protein